MCRNPYHMMDILTLGATVRKYHVVISTTMSSVITASMLTSQFFHLAKLHQSPCLLAQISWCIFTTCTHAATDKIQEMYRTSSDSYLECVPLQHAQQHAHVLPQSCRAVHSRASGLRSKNAVETHLTSVVNNC